MQPRPRLHDQTSRQPAYRVEVIAGAHDPKGLEGKLNEYDAEGWEVLCCEIVAAQPNPFAPPCPSLFVILRRQFRLEAVEVSR